MKHAVEPALPGTLRVFENNCIYCGARFRVMAVQGRFARDMADYSCPECGKRYETEAGREPQVDLLRPRRDGKDDQYQDTVF
jgi:hypothetical protein